MRVSTSARPWSNSWLPNELVLSPIALSASMVGWSCWMNEVNVEAPIRSPAATNVVLGFAVR